MLRDFIIFLQTFKSKCSFKKEKKNLILVSNKVLSLISLKSDIKNLLIEENKRTEDSFLLIVKIIKKGMIDRIGLLFRKEGGKIFLNLFPYYVTEEYTYKVNGLQLKEKESFPFKAVIQEEKTLNIALQTPTNSYSLVFEFVFIC